MAGKYPGPSCLEPHEVDYLLAGHEHACNPERWRRLAEHVEQCEDCQQLLSRAVSVPDIYQGVSTIASKQSQLQDPALPESFDELFLQDAIKHALKQSAHPIDQPSFENYLAYMTTVVFEFSLTGETAKGDPESAFENLLACVSPVPTQVPICQLALSLLPRNALGSLLRASACRIRIQNGLRVPADLLAPFRLTPSVGAWLENGRELDASDANKLLGARSPSRCQASPEAATAP
jgi:hypothetical protein